MSLITVTNLSVRLGAVPVLSGVDFTIARGEIVTIVGPNGSGKSTFLRCLIGALAPSTGQISRAPGLRIGYVPQKLAIDPTLPLTVGRFLSLPRRRQGADVEAALDQAGVPHLEARQMADLSVHQLHLLQKL